jgi:hypothetical protein
MHGGLEHVVTSVFTLCGEVAVFPIGEQIIGRLRFLFHRLKVPEEHNGEG